MIRPHYGDYTMARPCVVNIPDPLPGWVKVACPYCGQGCWQRPEIEPNPLPPNVTPACTNCALRRAHHQEAMDAERYAREFSPSPAPLPAGEAR